MFDPGRLAESGRYLLRENLAMTEDEVRRRLIERFAMDEQGMQAGPARLMADPTRRPSSSAPSCSRSSRTGR